MKFSPNHRSSRAFTLIELLVAMTITIIIVTVLVSITAIAMDTWNRSRSELRASRQAKAMIEALSKDFESIVARSGNSFEWMVAQRPSSLPGAGSILSANAAEVVLLTAVQDRYNGALSSPTARGDVSGVGYLLEFKDPISGGAPGGFPTFVLNRHLVNPDVAFENLIGQENLMTAFAPYRANLTDTENFICENVYQFTVTFQVEVVLRQGSGASATTTTYIVPVDVSSRSVSEFRLRGGGIDFVGTPVRLPAGVTEDDVRAGRLVGVELSLTVLTDGAANRVRRGALPGGQEQINEFLAENSYNYSRFIPLTSL